MSRHMLINAGDEESRVAIVEGGVLQDLHVESVHSGRLRGNIYKGTVVRVEPALQSCFVDFGTTKHGFLTMRDVGKTWWRKGAKGRPRIEEALRAGMHLPVQVLREPEGKKGAVLTTQVSLPGRYLVYVPDPVTEGGVSRQIQDEAQRKRLRKIGKDLCTDKGCTLIIRSVAEDRTKAELERDFRYLDRLWKAVNKAFNAAPRAGLVFHEQDVVVRCIRDHFTPDVAKVVIDSGPAYERALAFVQAAMPHHRKRFERYSGDRPLFAKHNVEAQIEETYRPRVRLKSGGSIVIDRTEALVAIDVNSGKAMRGGSMERTALDTNLEAAAEAARQLRLRDLGGLVVVDFIDLGSSRHRRQVEQAMKQAMKSDKARHRIGRISSFGMLEMSRQRLQPALAAASHDPCPTCGGTGLVRSSLSAALGCLRRIRDKATSPGVGIVRATVPRPAAHDLLNRKRGALAELEARTGVTVEVVPADLPPEDPGKYEVTLRKRMPKARPPEDDSPLMYCPGEGDGYELEAPPDAPDEPPPPPAEEEEPAKKAPAKRRRRRSRRRGGGKAGEAKDAGKGEAEGKAKAKAEPKAKQQPEAKAKAEEAGRAEAKQRPLPKAQVGSADRQADGAAKGEGKAEEGAKPKSSSSARRRRRRRSRRRRSGDGGGSGGGSGGGGGGGGE